MPPDLAGILMSRAQFEALATHCRADSEFPSWLDWNKLQIRATAAALAVGQDASPLAIDPENFKRWCLGVGIIPCLDALRAYTRVLRSDDTAALYRRALGAGDRPDAPD